MTVIAMRRFNVKNLDCAACAAKLENGLNQLATIDQVSLDFANLKLHVRTSDPAGMFEAVRRINPEVELEPEEGSTPDEALNNVSHFKFSREGGLLLVSTLLFGVHLLLGSWFHQKMAYPLDFAIVMIAYITTGWNVFLNAFRTLRRKDLFDENVLMVIATCGALVIQAYSEAIGVMIFYKIGEMLQEKSVNRSRRSIRSLLKIKPEVALLKTLQGIKTVSPETVRVGEHIIVKPGDKVPLDGKVISGESHLDSSVLTGESIPVKVIPGETVMAGQINRTGALTISVTRPFKDSSIAKILELVENATARKASTEKFITVFARYYTPAIVFGAALVAFLPPFLIPAATIKTWGYRALVLLVISCPCALVISIPLGYFGGIGKASRRGILVKGSNYIDALAQIKSVIFDKTGTLTKGVFRVLAVNNGHGFSKARILEMAAAAEYHSNHPIAQSILEALDQQGQQIDIAQLGEHVDLAGLGVRADYGGHTILVGNDNLLHTKGIEHERCVFDSSIAHVVVDGRYAGHLLIGDEIHPDAKNTITTLRNHGIMTIRMLTGDNHCVAAAVSQQLGLDGYHADLLPEDKVAIYEQLENDNQSHQIIAFVGDGVNDAPVIARADVGVAMGALGSDAAIDTADVVLMDDSPFKIAEAVSIAKHTRRIIWQNILLALVIKGGFIVLGLMGLASMWGAVFADMGTALIAVANSTRSYKANITLNA